MVHVGKYTSPMDPMGRGFTFKNYQLDLYKIDGFGVDDFTTWMSQELSKWLVNGL